MGVSLVRPPLILAYGPSGCGKSSDALWAAPQGLFVGLTSGLTAARSVIGFEPAFLDMDTTSDMESLRKQVRVKLREKKYPWVIIDDFSLIADRSLRLHREKYKDPRKLYGILAGQASDLFDDWRSFDVGVLVGCHEDAPTWRTDEKGNRLELLAPGGPQLPGRKSTPAMVKSFDLAYRVVRCSAADPTWPFAYAAGPFSPDPHLWESKDRWHVCNGGSAMGSLPAGHAPMNLGEILRSIPEMQALGLSLERAPGFETVEPMVTWVTEQVLAGQSERQVLTTAAQHMQSAGASLHQIRWMVRDARARILLQRKKVEGAFFAELGLGSSLI